MDQAQRQQFVSSYTKVLTTAWTDETFLGRLRSDPKSVLGEFSLGVPASATVNILTEAGGEPNLDQAVAIWEEGQSSGVYRLCVPPEPPQAAEELSGRLDADGKLIAADTSACCCCSSPCCCCT